MGVEDCSLGAMRDAIAPGRRIVVLAKHLCGRASDYALRAIAAAADDPLGPPVAVVLGTCCHHRCDWQAYPARDYLASLQCGDAPADFVRLCRLSSSGVDATDDSPRADAGRRAKDILDEGRASYLRTLGYEASLRRYCDASVTPENVLVVASR